MSGPLVVCGMSGGVDSSVAAALLLEGGARVIGVTMRLSDTAPAVSRGRGTCCAPAEIDRARDACDRLGIPHYVFDERERFSAQVIDPALREWASGRTPNPCTRCNQHVKFAPLWARARALGAQAIATGHYARHEDGKLLRARDASKDQSYFLFALGRAQLQRLRLPLGTWTKAEVRDKARALGLPAADVPDSQELCFVPDGDPRPLIASRAAALGLSSDALAPGPIVDEGGAVVGEHNGIAGVTVGMRRGLGVALGERRYVLKVIAETRTVIVGAAESLETSALIAEEFQWLVDPSEEVFQAGVRVRYRSEPTPARVRVRDGRAKIELLVPVRGVAPGQAAVVYENDTVLGGGWIGATMPSAGSAP